MDQPREWTDVLPSRSGFLPILVPALAAAVCLVTMTLPTPLALGAPIAIAGALAVVLHPILGLAGLIFGGQIGGLIERIVPGPGDWVLEALAGVVLVGVAVNSYKERRETRWGPDVPGIRMAILFGIVVLVSCLFADNLDLALTGSRKMLSLFVLLYLIVRLARTRKLIRLLIFAVVASTALSGAVSSAGYLTGKQLVPSDEIRGSPDRQRVRQAGASSEDATAASRSLLAGTAIALVMALRDRKRRLLYGLCGLLGLSGVVLTFSRSTSLVLLLAMGWFSVKFLRRRRLPQVVAAAAVMATIGLMLIPQDYWQRLSTLRSPGEDWTLGRRLGYHLIGIDLLRQHPFIGVGPDNYKEHYLDYKYRAMPGRRLEARAMHNMYLSVAVETGLLGFVCFAGILFVALRGLARARARAPDPESRWMAEAVQFALAVFLVASLFGAAETSKYLWILSGLAMAVAQVALPRVERSPGWNVEAPGSASLQPTV